MPPATRVSAMEPDLKCEPLIRWPDTVSECVCVCFELLRDYSDDGRCELPVNAFCQKSPVYAAHAQITTISIMLQILL